eukprot:s3668_g6.t1
MYMFPLLQPIRVRSTPMERRLAAVENAVEDLTEELRFLRLELGRIRRRSLGERSSEVGPSQTSFERVRTPTPSSEEQVPGIEVFGPPRARQSPTPAAVPLAKPYPSPTTSLASSCSLTWAQREAICDQIADFICRSLNGEHRRNSGRDQIKLGSRLWLVFRDYEGYEHNPVTVCRTFAACRALTKRGEDCGESIFIGLPTEHEARRVVRSSGLEWPPEL